MLINCEPVIYENSKVCWSRAASPPLLTNSYTVQGFSQLSVIKITKTATWWQVHRPHRKLYPTCKTKTASGSLTYCIYYWIMANSQSWKTIQENSVHRNDTTHMIVAQLPPIQWLRLGLIKLQLAFPKWIESTVLHFLVRSFSKESWMKCVRVWHASFSSVNTWKVERVLTAFYSKHSCRWCMSSKPSPREAVCSTEARICLGTIH